MTGICIFSVIKEVDAPDITPGFKRVEPAWLILEYGFEVAAGVAGMASLYHS
ncbi:MAG: hypothetical protein U5K79_19155 [Cyclobacteriaceae bacterium]|nr:hypothetical protein [Cyclobacteriaceae bacterium]